ncbi:MAG: hypothetical protein ACAI35_17635 [Candidatus Methylacidiphilales bacterium]|nr:hypothetical protein [Candidatus Methylacidiphilales bacterium]
MATTHHPLPVRLLQGPDPNAGFSLVEVVLAIGIFSFCIVAIMSLFSLGMATSKESDEEIRAANLATSILCRMRIAPHVDLTSQGFPFGVLTNSAGGTVFEIAPENPLFIKGDGTVAATAEIAMSARGFAGSAKASFDTTSQVSRISLTLWWPAVAPYNRAVGRYSVTTYIDTEAR